VQAGEHCDDGNTTDGDCCSATCTLPAGACRAAAKSQLLLKDDARDDDARDKLVWKWKRGEPTSQAELADPTATTDYAFCFYDASGLVLDAGVRANAARWSALRDQGYRYGDKSGAEDGFTRILLRGSAEPKAKAELKGSGPNLPLPPLGSLSLPVFVQLRNEETGVCLESVFDAEDVLANDAGQFKARAR
jgi:cysteine-rich repeat protein